MFDPVTTGSGESDLVICRSENEPPATVTHCENSDVSPNASVAVAVMNCPTATVDGKVTLNKTLQLASVVTTVEPMNV